MSTHFARIVVGAAESGAVGMLLAKITLLLAAAWVVQAAIGRLNPRWRVLVWRVTGSAIVVLCVLALSPPFVRLAILPGSTPELAAGGPANPATSMVDRAELRDPNRRIPAAANATATEAEQLTEPNGSDATTRPGRPGTAHADPEPAALHAVGATEQLPASLDNQPAGAASMPHSLWLLGLWCAGAGLSALATCVGLWRLRTIRATAGPVPDWVQSEAARVASAMGVGRGFELRQTQSLQTPCLVGVRGPMILLPARQCEPQYSDELPAILAHELAHLKGADLFWNATLNALAIGLWFHPLAWRMRLAHADACDAVCDALASDHVGDAGVYGRTLARLTLRITRAGAAPGLAMARVSSVERRIAAVRRHVFRTGLSRRRVIVAVTIAAAAIAVLGGLAFVPSQAGPPSAADAQKQPSPAPSQLQESPTIGSTAGPSGEPQPAVNSRALRKVFAAWKAREERIKSFYFAWTFHVALHKAHQAVRDGYCFPFAGGLVLADKGEGAVGVDKDVDFTAPQSEWSGDGFDRLRSDYTEFRHRAVDGWTETRRFRVTQDGILNSRLQIPVRSADEAWIALWRKAPIKHPSRLRPRVQLFEESEIDLTPLRLALRPSRTAPEWSPENCWVISEDALVGHVHCIELQMDKVNHSERCWVDPQRDYSVVRWQRRDNQLAPLDFAVEVQQGPDGEWLPQRWSWQISDATGARAASFDATVTRRMINKKLPATTFVADYPRGTRVYDATVDLPINDADDQSGMLPPDEAKATLDAIADAWLQRQSKAKRWKYSWSTKGARHTINTLEIDGEKFMRANRTLPPLPQPDPAPDGRVGWPILQRKRVFDGAVTRDLWLTDDPTRPGGILNITAGSDGPNGRSELLETGDSYLSLIFRPFDPRFGRLSVAELHNPARFRVRKQKGKIGNVACVVIETEERPGMPVSFWLDPARDYIPMRLHRVDDGEDLARLEISYKADPTCGWIPVDWTEARVRSGVPAQATIVDTITDFMVNQPIPTSDFQIDAPPNVTVQDMRIDRRSARRKAREAALEAREAKRKASLAAKEAQEKTHPKPTAKPVYDPFADPAADLDAAFKLAQETNKRVLIEFGANWCPGCRVLGGVLKENAEVSAALKRSFVLVFVNTESESGRHLQEKYVPKRQQNSIPHLAVLDASGKVLKNDDTTAFEVDDDYSVPKLKAFLAEWSPRK
jgi:beta-lactamase regulating signal transducer with metallopeptidase domain/thiol-disulfide isomerase/thioredoxin